MYLFLQGDPSAVSESKSPQHTNLEGAKVVWGIRLEEGAPGSVDLTRRIDAFLLGVVA